MIRRLVVAAVVPLVLLAGCGEDTGADPVASDTSSGSPSALESEGLSESASASVTESESADAATSPACEEVWVDEQKLPGTYKGCYDGEQMIKPDGRYCEFGKKLFTHDDRFYSVKGGTIHEAQEPFRTDPGYQDTLAKCSG